MLDLGVKGHISPLSSVTPKMLQNDFWHLSVKGSG